MGARALVRNWRLLAPQRIRQLRRAVCVRVDHEQDPVLDGRAADREPSLQGCLDLATIFA